MMKFVSYLFALLLVVAIFVPDLTFAQFTTGGGSGFTTGGGSRFTTGGGCGLTNGTVELCDPLGIKNFCDLVKKLLDIVVAIGIPVAVFFLVWAGFKFIIARGNPTELETAKKNFYYVIIGIGVFLGAWTFATVLSATIQTLDSSGTIQFCGR